jgi:selenide,water dikinase
LSQVVRQLAGLFPATEYPDVLVGLGQPDDAAVIRLDETRALIQTTDFFTPIVDDPWLYGGIAAANAMSDVYAMGGEVVTCLNIAGFPETMDPQVIGQIFSGGAAKVREAGAAITGGHTVTNAEPFYGLSVTGIIHPDRVMRKGGARPGDQLFLSKPLGTGVVTTAAKLAGLNPSIPNRLIRLIRRRPRLDPAHLEAAIRSMTRLNRAASQAAQIAQVQSATDITGFGLLGHACEMLLADGADVGMGFRINSQAVPLLPGAEMYAGAGYLTRGLERNPAHYGEHVTFADGVQAVRRSLLWESETSGGLLMAVPAATVDQFRAACAEREQSIWLIGEVIKGRGIQVT